MDDIVIEVGYNDLSKMYYIDDLSFCLLIYPRSGLGGNYCMTIEELKELIVNYKRNNTGSVIKLCYDRHEYDTDESYIERIKQLEGAFDYREEVSIISNFKK